MTQTTDVVENVWTIPQVCDSNYLTSIETDLKKNTVYLN